jgi:hypothetical protein
VYPTYLLHSEIDDQRLEASPSGCLFGLGVLLLGTRFLEAIRGGREEEAGKKDKRGRGERGRREQERRSNGSGRGTTRYKRARKEQEQRREKKDIPGMTKLKIRTYSPASFGVA